MEGEHLGPMCNLVFAEQAAEGGCRYALRVYRGEGVDPDFCTVSFAGDRPVNVELISPREHIDLLARAAERYGLDGEAIEAAARSALAAPDRVVVLDVLARAAH